MNSIILRRSTMADLKYHAEAFTNLGIEPEIDPIACERISQIEQQIGRSLPPALIDISGFAGEVDTQQFGGFSTIIFGTAVRRTRHQNSYRHAKLARATGSIL